MPPRIYGICRRCGNLVYREPGTRYGDGQIDNDDAPVWLLDCQADDDEFAGRLDGAEAADMMVPGRIVDCGCCD